MAVLFVAASVKVVVGILTSGLVLGGPTPAAPTLPTWYYLALLIIFQLWAGWLFVGGRRDERARALATLFVLFATLFTDRITAQAVHHTGDGLDRALLLIASVQLVALCPYAFWRFAYAFPRRQPIGNDRWIRPVMEYATIMTGVVLVTGNLLARSRVGERWGLPAALAWTSQNDDRVFWQALTLLTLACLALLLAKWRRAALTERRRLAWVVAGIVVGTLPMLIHILLAVVFPQYAVFSNEPETRRWLGIVLTLFTLCIPVTTTYAVVVDQVLDVSLVVRRGVQYALAKYTVLTAIAGLTILTAFVVYRNRARPLAEIVVGSPMAVSVGVILLVMLVSRRALLSAIDRRFFRDHHDARQILLNLAERSHSLHSARDVTEMLVGEVGRALHLERVVLLLLDDSGETLGDSQGRVLPLSFSGPLAAILSGSRSPLDVDLSTEGSALSRLPAAEREWLSDAGARLIVPLFGVRDTPIGVLVLGDKRSELPFTHEDKRLMTAVAASAAMAIEQKLSRESPDPDTPAVPRGNASQCASCGRVQPRSSPRCHTCAGPLREGPLPVVLAGKFEVERQIGAGGMGVVYRGRDLGLDRPVAMKVLPRVGPAGASRLRREARAMAAFQHPHLAVIHVLESWRGSPVLVLEYLAGGTLADRLRHGPLPLGDVLSIFIATAEVLRHIHDAGYLHRDIKPSNLGFTFHGTPKLLDFGLAQMIADLSSGSTRTAGAPAAASHGDAPMHTSLRHFIGTPAYMSPEALAQESPGPFVDLWSLAVTMYEALTGNNPFRGSSLQETVKLVVAGPVPDVRVARPDCPPAIAQLLSHALAHDRHRRPQSAGEFVAVLQSVAPPAGERSRQHPEP